MTPRRQDDIYSGESVITFGFNGTVEFNPLRGAVEFNDVSLDLDEIAALAAWLADYRAGRVKI